jgi:hypothetical protein
MLTTQGGRISGHDDVGVAGTYHCRRVRRRQSHRIGLKIAVKHRWIDSIHKRARLTAAFGPVMARTVRQPSACPNE